jgi:flagellar hook-length control protein FliK
MAIEGRPPVSSAPTTSGFSNGAGAVSGNAAGSKPAAHASDAAGRKNASHTSDATGHKNAAHTSDAAGSRSGANTSGAAGDKNAAHASNAPGSRSGANASGAAGDKNAAHASNSASSKNAANASDTAGDKSGAHTSNAASGKSGTNASNAAANASGAAAGAAGPADPAADRTDFMTILANTAAATSSAATATSDKPAEVKNDDDGADDEIGFEDLSEFLTQVLIPGANVPAQPAGTSDTEVEIDFTQDDAALTSDMMSGVSVSAGAMNALSAAQNRFAEAIAKTDPVFSLDTSLLKDALAAERLKADALDSKATALADPKALDGSSPSAFSALHAAALHSPSSTAHTSLQAEVRSPMGTQAWADEVGGHLTWMASNGKESASLTLSPEHLGPIEVSISTQDGKTSVWFGAQNADTRAAIEQALPRLRDLFSSQGLSLADSGVFREAPRQPQQSFSGAANSRAGGDEISGVTSVAKRGNGILDLYA